MDTRLAGVLVMVGVLSAACGGGVDTEHHEVEVVEAADPERCPGEIEVEKPRIVVTWDPVEPEDLDGDGFPADVDHDDENPLVFPGASEVPCNGVDEDGDLVDPCPPDIDGDGVRSDLDCDDGDPDRHPQALETRCNGLDENCDGHDDCDRDEDGVLDWVDLDPDDPGVGLPPSDVDDALH